MAPPTHSLPLLPGSTCHHLTFCRALPARPRCLRWRRRVPHLTLNTAPACYWRRRYTTVTHGWPGYSDSSPQCRLPPPPSSSPVPTTSDSAALPAFACALRSPHAATSTFPPSPGHLFRTRNARRDATAVALAATYATSAVRATTYLQPSTRVCLTVILRRAVHLRMARIALP